jgi:hypothetical protein
VWYQCYRAACGARGRYSDSGGLTLTTGGTAATRADPYIDAQPINRELAETFSRYGSSHQALLGHGVCEHEGLALFPISNVAKNRIRPVGWQKRGVSGKRKLVMNEYFEEPHFQYAVVNYRGDGPVVVVENILSAYRVASCTNRCAIALLGHILLPGTALQMAQEWRRQQFRVLLDPDTWPSGITTVLRGFEAVGLEADARHIIKKPYALSPGELREAVS